MVLSIAMFIRDCSSIGRVKCFFLASSITLWSLNSNLVAKLVGHSEHWIGLLAAVWRFSMCRSKLNRFFNSVPQWLHFIFLVESLHLFCLMCRSIANLEWSSLSHLAHLEGLVCAMHAVFVVVKCLFRRIFLWAMRTWPYSFFRFSHNDKFLSLQWK